MVKRLDRLPDEQLTAEINGIITDFNALKTAAQPLTGDSLVILANTSGNTYDINDSFAAYAQHQYRVIFKPDKMVAPFADFNAHYGYSNPDGYEVAGAGANVAYTSTGQLAWDFLYTADANAGTLTANFTVYCPGTGTITVTKVS
jgi:hypothetical protein